MMRLKPLKTCCAHLHDPILAFAGIRQHCFDTRLHRLWIQPQVLYLLQALDPHYVRKFWAGDKQNLGL